MNCCLNPGNLTSTKLARANRLLQIELGDRENSFCCYSADSFTDAYWPDTWAFVQGNEAASKKG